MGWEEKQREIQRRQREEKEAQLATERLRQEEEDRRKTIQPTPQQAEALRQEVIRIEVSRLPEAERNVFELLSILDVKGVLSEIQRDSWKGRGKIEEFVGKDDFISDVIKPEGRKGTQLKKGVMLSYSYEYPELSLEPVYERKFGKHTVVVEGSSWTTRDGENRTNSGSYETRGFYNAHVGYLPRFSMEKGNTSTKVAIIRCAIKFDRWADHGYPALAETKFYLHAPGYSGGANEFFQLDPDSISVGGARKFLEDRLLEDDQRRKSDQQLPLSLEGKIRSNLSIINSAIKKGVTFPVSYQIWDARKQLGLVPVY